MRVRPLPAGVVTGFGLGGLADGVLLHQVLQWHHLVSDEIDDRTVDGLERNTLADGLFHVAVVTILVVGGVLLWRAARHGAVSGRRALGGIAVGWGLFHLTDQVVFHLALDLHHIRMVDDYLVYDLAFTAFGIVLLAVGLARSRDSG